VKRTLIYRLVQITRGVFIHAPRELALTLGAAVGLTLWFTQRKDKFRASRHLLCAYGDKYSLNYNKCLIRKAFINTGYNLCDTFRLETKFKSEIEPLIDVIGKEHILKAYQKGKGVICPTGHVGNFELLAAYMGRNGFKTAVIGREIYDIRLNRLLVNNRQANNIKNIPTTRLRQLLAKLKDGYVVGALVDNDSHRVKSAFVESYGRLANSPIGLTLIGLRLKIPFVPVTCRRIGKRYLIRFFPAITINSDTSVSDHSREQEHQKALAVTQLIRKILDSEVDKDPSQWIWVHNRWQTRYDGSPTNSRQNRQENLRRQYS
jgi:Kdo2-lipid IVA lauroyltransferase/acyltransferase